VIHSVKTSPVKGIELIVVDDGSTDGTRSILRRQRRLIDVLVLQPFNKGKGSAVKTGVARARGEVVIIQDADLEYDPQEYPRLVNPILSGRADAVYGSRFIGGDPHRVVYFSHFVGNKLLTLLSNIFTGLNMSDMETGYKAFRRQLVQSVQLDEPGFGFEPEVTTKVAASGARIYEVGISYHGRTYQEGKKIGPADFFKAVWVVIRCGSQVWWQRLLSAPKGAQ